MIVYKLSLALSANFRDCLTVYFVLVGDLHGKVQATSLCGVQALVQQSVNQAAVDGFFIKAAQIFQQSIVKCTTVARCVDLKRNQGY